MSDSMKVEKYAVGDTVNTTWGTGWVQEYRKLDHLYIVLLNNWSLAQGQSPTLYLAEESITKVDDNESDDDSDEDEDVYGNLPPPALMRHITIEEDSLPPTPVMIRLASRNAEKEKVSCCICDELVLHGVGHLRLGCRCLCHEACFVKYIRSKSRADWGRAGGISCPYALGAMMCAFKGQNNETYRITPNDLGQMIKLLGCADRESARSAAEIFRSDAFITLDEIEKYETWILEFQQAGKLVIDNGDTFSPEDEATKVFIDATTKGCPKCGLRATHYHGHSCHHIYGGCEGCSEEYCYRCLCTASENEEVRGDRTSCLCGSWETFCNNEDLEYFLVLKPYPHDSRCGCTICPECRLDNPCEMCDGSCVVCDGVILPPPLGLEGLDSWDHQCSCTDLAPGTLYISGAMLQSVNGVFYLDSDEGWDGEGEGRGVMPIYVKKQYEDDEGEDSVTLKCVEFEDMWCWRLMCEDGADTDDCRNWLAYVIMDLNSIALPHSVEFAGLWSVQVNGQFLEQAAVAAQLVQPGLALDPEYETWFEQGRAEFARRREEYLAEVARDPQPGSVTVSGVSERADGVYEPSNDRLNDVAVYRRKGSRAFSLQFIRDTLGCSWRVNEADKPALAYQAYRVVVPCGGGGCDYGSSRANDSDIDSNDSFLPIDEVTLPHTLDGDSAVWLVLGDCDYVMKMDVTVTLFYPLGEVPSRLMNDLRAAQVNLNAYRNLQRDDKLRHAVTGSITVKFPSFEMAAAGFGLSSYKRRCVGTYEPTANLVNSLPVYVKQGDQDVSLENGSGSQWVIRAPVVRNSSNLANIVATCDLAGDHLLPIQADNASWKFRTSLTTFEVCSDLAITHASKQLLSDNILNILSESQKSMLRDPLPGSVVVAGAAGARAYRVNGIFEPTEEVYNGMPVYRKKGVGEQRTGTWLEMVTGTTGRFRWYVKPTANRGASSVCFGYLDIDKSSLKLPHDMGEGEWHVYDGTGFVKQAEVKSCLHDPLQPVPPDVLGLLSERQKAVDAAATEKQKLMALPPVPGSLSIEGASGSRAYGINGVFEPTGDLYNDLPCYKKKGEEVWVEMVHGASGYRWYIKPSANRGPSSVCFAYCKFDEINPTLPHDRSVDRWRVFDGKEFVEQSDVVTTLLPVESEVPKVHVALLAECKRVMAVQRAEMEALMGVPPLPGSFTISGASGTREHRVNGTFEPSGELQHGLPVYKKKGDADTWVELVEGISGLRWYVKPTKEKGEHSSVCYAFKGVSASNVNLPQSCGEESWSVFDGTTFTVQSDVRCLLSRDGEGACPGHLLELVEEANKSSMASKHSSFQSSSLLSSSSPSSISSSTSSISSSSSSPLDRVDSMTDSVGSRSQFHNELHFADKDGAGKLRVSGGITEITSDIDSRKEQL